MIRRLALAFLVCVTGIASAHARIAAHTTTADLPLHAGHQPHLARPQSGRARVGTHDNVRVDRHTDCALKAFALRYATEALQASESTQALVHDALELGTECGVQHPFDKSGARSHVAMDQQQQQRYSAFFPSQLKWTPPTTFKTQSDSGSSTATGSGGRKSESADSNKRQPQHGRINRKSQHQRGGLNGGPGAPLLNLFVDVNAGSDSNPGTESSPVQSFAQALRLLRFARPASGPIDELAQYAASITFRAGAYFFAQPVQLSERDSFLTIQAYPDEEVLFSGGLDLSQLEWSTYAGGPVLQAQLPAGACTAASCFNEMYLSGRRAVRARFPNGNPETAGLWTVNNTGYIPAAAAWLPAWPPQGLPTTVALSSPTRNSKNFPSYQLGVGGAADAFQPPTSFWATLAPPAGNTYTVPGGLVFVNETWSGRTYADPSIALVHTFHGAYWGNWIFSVGAIKELEQTIQFSGGGFQEARGTTIGREWYIENLLEELDAEEEWWLDAAKGTLYFYPNATKLETVPSDTAPGKIKLRARDGNPLSLVGTQTDSILVLSGSSETRLLQSVVISGLTFAHTSSTFMRAMEVPSGGDWSLLRVGAVQFENTRDSLVEGCSFRGVGGNGVVISGANVNTTVAFNEFVWIGSSAVLVAGRTLGIDGASRMLHAQGTVVRGNLMHELGIWVKQSSGVGVALARGVTIDGNIVFNVARAGINFNDGFGGGHYVTHNLIFNAVRETDDHGPINTWDRQPFLAPVTAPPSEDAGADFASTFSASLHPLESFIHHNFLICNYMSLWPLDHDDGSSFWTDTQNYMIYGGYKSYLGNSLMVTNNFYILPDGKVDAVAEQRKHRRATKDAGGSDADAESSIPPALQGLSSIMIHRAANLRDRYHITAAGLEARDKALASGVSIEKALLLQSEVEDSLRASFAADDADADLTGGTVCCEDGGGYGHQWSNNTCTVLDVSHVYNLWACDLLSLPTSIPFLAFNALHASGELSIRCGDTNLTLAQMQKLGYEWGTVQSPPADLATMLQWGETLFGMQPGRLLQDATDAAHAIDAKHSRLQQSQQQSDHEDESTLAALI